MPWGYDRSDDDGFSCPSCCDWTLYDDPCLDCARCQEVFCMECLEITCDMCKENICESCMSFPGCKDCGNDVTICTGCMKDHLQTCNKKTRAERIIAAEEHEMDKRAEEIESLKYRIESDQAKLVQLQEEQTAARKRKLAAEAALAREGNENKKARIE